MNNKIERVGEINGVSLYYDVYQEKNKFLMGYKERKLDFIIGCTKDIEVFRKALELFKNN